MRERLDKISKAFLKREEKREVDRDISSYMHEQHMQSVRAAGIEPLSLKAILGFRNLIESVSRLVLFDSPADGAGLGNHWTIQELDIDNGRAVLVPSSAMGRTEAASRTFAVSLDEPFFTGASLTTTASDDIYWAAGFKDRLGLSEDHCIFV